MEIYWYNDNQYINYIIVTQSDKKGLIAGKYMCSLINMYLKFSIR